TSAGGMAEAVRDGVDGYVIPVRDIPAMVEKLTTLLGDGQLRERMGRSARERVEAEFTLERQAKVFGQMYEAAQLQHKSIVTTTS
ncbi:MAG: glycosyltransferase, partial [Pseudomonadales bacterium]|nr:glycosyltransferase [Pseudomonadales bacterium]